MRVVVIQFFDYETAGYYPPQAASVLSTSRAASAIRPLFSESAQHCSSISGPLAVFMKCGEVFIDFSVSALSICLVSSDSGQ